MDLSNGIPSSNPTKAAEVPAVPPPKKRFRIEKIEERITPDPHFNPHSKLVGAGNGGNVGSISGSLSGSIY